LAIDIRIHRKGETLRPTDFFSQSQVQTLVLGLFLTACSFSDLVGLFVHHDGRPSHPLR
jgi:hypothetical protein